MDDDLHTRSHRATETHRRTGRSEPQLQSTASVSQPLSYSSPLPQQVWEPQMQMQQRRRQPIHMPESSPAAPRTRRTNRTSSFRDLLGQTTPGVDYSVVDQRPISGQSSRSTLHTPNNELSRRAVSQPNTPAAWEQQHEWIQIPESYRTFLPRSPTYPPAGRRRSAADATFTDDEEFQLFVEATAGLEQEQTYRQWSSSPAWDQDEEMRSGQMLQVLSDQIISPVQETPTTVYALQQLAQLPVGSNPTERRRVEVPQTPISQRLSTAMTGVDLWLHPPDDPYEDFEPVDDELPNYAQSQAEAEAAQRIEAARRAQELQRRWQQSR